MAAQVYRYKRELNMNIFDEYKRDVFYIFNPDETCNFATKEYNYTEFWEINERFCQECYIERVKEIKTLSDEHQNHLMQSLEKKQKDAFKDSAFYELFRHKYCNHRYCDKCNDKILLLQDYVLVNPDNEEHLFSNVKQNYLVCSCSDSIYLPVIEEDIFPAPILTNEDNIEMSIISADRIKKGYSLLKNPRSDDANTKIIRVNEIDIQNRIWFLSKHIPIKMQRNAL